MFRLTEGATSVDLTVTSGSYNTVNLQVEITRLLNTYSPNGYTYTMTYPNATEVGTDKWTFTCSAPIGTYIAISVGGEQQGIDLDPVLQGMWLQLGFLQNSTNVFTPVGIPAVLTLVSVNAISISYINRIFLYSDACAYEIDNLLLDCLFVGQYPFLAYCYWENLTIDTNAKTFSGSKSNSYRFWLQDEYGKSLNLNGLDWNFTLIFYRKDDTSYLMKEKMLVDLIEEIETKAVEIAEKKV